MTSSSSALSLIALFLFAASTHGQLITLPPINFPTINLPPITLPGRPPINLPPITLPPITFPPIGSVPPIAIPPVSVPPISIPPVGNPLPIMVNIVGQLCCTANGSCPGQVLSGVPATLSCLLDNNVTTIVSRTITNDNGTFTLNATLSPASIINTVSNIPTNGFPVCVVTIGRSAVNATLCPVLGTTGSALNTTGSAILSIVRFVGPIIEQVLNGRASAFATI